MAIQKAALSLLLGFALGSIPFGWIAGRLRGLNIQERGSGNIGFSNVQRMLGWTWGLPVLLLDAAKGVAPVLFAPMLELDPALGGLGAVFGHIFTPWLRFKGGKGVATTLGALALLCPRSLLPGLGVFLAVLLPFGFISLSSIATALMLPLLTALFYPGRVKLLVVTICLALLILLRHRDNIERLTHGHEPRLGLWVKLFRKGVA